MLGWALNEEQSVERYVERAAALLVEIADDYELIIIDDGSTDRTWEILSAMRVSRPWLRPYRNEVNRGSGFNTKRAISLATKEYLFWQTVDWAYDITALADNAHLLGQYDVLQGVRRNALALRQVFSARSDNPYKGLVSWVNYSLIRLLFQVPISDYQNVTVYPRALIQRATLESESSFTNPECLLKTWWQGASFKEIPVPFIKRDTGIGKGTRPLAIARAITDILYWWFVWVVLGRREHRGRGRVTPISEYES
ncbi:MAG TPA: glycosyltransferase family 2 protein [Vicinamibacterales bacterium]|nr:glycosyltransferase family 2 protein [Vicinamibacterales bacterium]